MTQEEVSQNLLFPLFRCLDDSYKERYKKNIWEQFENAIRSAAYTARLTTFFQNIHTKLPITSQAQYLEQMNAVIASGLDKTILTWLRDETAYLVLLTRLQNQERRDAYKQQHEETTSLSEPDSLTNKI